MTEALKNRTGQRKEITRTLTCHEIEILLIKEAKEINSTHSMLSTLLFLLIITITSDFYDLTDI